ncbi:MAG: ABC transporter ATP-binding protein [Verrucomicrobia bacterium]|nr:ABC transporter ATP-binding protein [Verrucomicrobiota bacterium]
MSAVELEGVSKSYGSMRAVDRMDLTVESGEFVTLLGPSGCGKSTTLQMVAGFVRPSTGHVRIGERDCTRLAPHLRNVGMVFQNYALFPHMTLFGNIEFGLRMRRVPKAERSRLVAEAMALVRLDHLADRYPGQISGGQQQRVALARALVIQPDVLLLDEPFGALDKQLRDRMRVDLRSLQLRLGISMVFVTHDQDEALSMSDRIAVMSEGRIRQIGTPDDIYERPVDRFVAEFMGESNILSARVLSSAKGRTVVEVEGLRLALVGSHDPGAVLELMIRPEKIGLRLASLKDGAPRGQVVDLQYFGASVHYRVALKGGPVLSVIHRDAGLSDRVSPGTEISLNIPETLPIVVGP